MTHFHERGWTQQDHQQFMRSLNWAELDDPQLQMKQARRMLDGNNERMKENLYHLETSLKCARQGQWYCMEHFSHLYTDAERKRLAIRLELMEQYHVEHHDNPYNEQEHALYTELWGLLRAMLETAKERDAELVAAFYEQPSGPRSHDVYQHRHNAEMCATVYQWIASWGTRAKTDAVEVSE